MLYSQTQYDMHMISEIKAKNKQITFLEDKIILMQKDRQSKIEQISQKYHAKMKKLKYINSQLDQQNCQLRQKVQSYKLKLTNFSQQFKKSSQESKDLLEIKCMTQLQVKKTRTKLQKQKKNRIKLQQENLQLKTIVNMNQKTIKELNAKNFKLVQEKNILMRTYGDYDQIKHDLNQISRVYQDQYQSELELVKNRLRHQMQSNTKQIMNDFSNVHNEAIQSKLRRVKSTQCFLHSQQPQQQQDKLKIDDLKQNPLKTFIKTTTTIFPKKNKLVNLVNSFEEDMINLKNYVSYGQQYVASFQGQNLNQQETKIIYKFMKKLINQNSQLRKENQLHLQKLEEMKQQMQERMKFIQNSMSQLKQADVDKVNMAIQTTETQMPLLRINDMNIILKNKLKQCGQIISYLSGIFMVLSQVLMNNNYKIQKYYIPMAHKQFKGIQKSNKTSAKIRLKSLFLSVIFIEHLKKKARKAKRLQKLNSLSKMQKNLIKQPNISKILQKCVTQVEKSKIQRASNCQIQKYISIGSIQKKYNTINLLGRFLNQQTLTILGKQKLQLMCTF